MVNHFRKSSVLQGEANSKGLYNNTEEQNREMAEQIVVDAGSVDQLSGSRISIVNQGCVMNENSHKNGRISKQVHVVVKNLAFQMEVESNVDLSKANLGAKLIYDLDNEEDQKVEVSYVKNEPLEYKVNYLDSGVKAIIEIKIKVLTSQHEDMLFRVLLYGTDPVTFAPFELLSKPIKVISKMTQGSARKGQPVQTPTTPTLTPPNKKRASPPAVAPDSISVILSNIEKHQEAQLNLLTSIGRKILLDESLSSNMTQSALHALTSAITQHVQMEGYSSDMQKENNNEPMVDVEKREVDMLEVYFRKFASAALTTPDAHVRLIGILSNIQPEEAERIIDILSAVTENHSRKKAKLDSSQS